METVKSIWEGKTLLRTRLHQSLRAITIEGVVIDVGGGIDPEYLRHFKSVTGAFIKSVDLKATDEDLRADLENDPLPCATQSVDTVLLFNVLEHIYNHRHVLGEIRRIVKPNGKLIGFVPFLINYHPDPHDYFRYTGEALTRLLADAGFQTSAIVEIGGGPFSVNYNNIVLSVPRIVRIVLLPIYMALDMLFLKFRPHARKRYPLGYLFIAS